MKSEYKNGQDVMVFFRDKWRPAKLIFIGRKWATVALNGRTRHSKVAIAAIRTIEAKPPAPSPSLSLTPSPSSAPPESAEGIRLDEFDSYVRIRDGAIILCAIAKAHRELAEELVAALKAWRQARR